MTNETNESKPSPKSGNKGSGSMKTQTSVSEPARIVRLRSRLEGGGDHPGTGLSVPSRGVIFEVAADQGQSLIACGLAEAAPEGAKGE